MINRYVTRIIIKQFSLQEMEQLNLQQSVMMIKNLLELFCYGIIVEACLCTLQGVIIFNEFQQGTCVA
jgi:hypothetical protein